jgi:hypothetical protein
MWCFIHRWRIAAALDNGRALPEATERHLSACPACRADLAAGKALAEGLAVGAGASCGVPAGLHGRMMEAIRAEGPVRGSAMLVWRVWAPLGGVALCMLLAAGLIALFAGVKVSSVAVVSGGAAVAPSPLAQVSGLAPAFATFVAATGQNLPDPLAPEWAAIEQSASAATRTVLAAALDRLPGLN